MRTPSIAAALVAAALAVAGAGCSTQSGPGATRNFGFEHAGAAAEMKAKPILSKAEQAAAIRQMEGLRRSHASRAEQSIQRAGR